MTGEPHAAPSVTATELELTAEEGSVFGPVSFTLGATGLTAITGPGESGRTALSLVISGRMKPTGGTVEVLGMTAPAQIRRHVALAGVDQLDELPRSVRVRDILTENKAWSRPWYRPTSRATQDELVAVCAPVFGDRDLPPLDAWISDLTSLDRLLLRISLSLRPSHPGRSAGGRDIRMLVMDDLEQVREHHDRAVLVHLLARMAGNMPVIVNTVNPLPPDAPAHTVVQLGEDPSHLQPVHSGWDDPPTAVLPTTTSENREN